MSENGHILSENTIFTPKSEKMNKYGNAFRLIRKIKGIKTMEAAEGMNMDIRTLRRYESDETPLISPTFDHFIDFYKISFEVVHELVKNGATNHNIIQTINGDQTVVHQNQPQSETEKLEKRILEVEAQNQQLIENDRFQKNLIEQLMNKGG